MFRLFFPYRIDLLPTHIKFTEEALKKRTTYNPFVEEKILSNSARNVEKIVIPWIYVEGSGRKDDRLIERAIYNRTKNLRSAKPHPSGARQGVRIGIKGKMRYENKAYNLLLLIKFGLNGRNLLFERIIFLFQIDDI